MNETSVEQLNRLSGLWDLQPGEVAAIFGVTEAAVAKWRRSGVPADHRTALSDLASATDELEARVRRGRISAVVRQPAGPAEESSLLDLALEGRHAFVRDLVHEMFDLRRVQP